MTQKFFFFLSPKTHYCSLTTYKHCSPKLNNSTATLATRLLIMRIIFYLLINSISKKNKLGSCFNEHWHCCQRGVIKGTQFNVSKCSYSFLLFLYYFLTDPTPAIWIFNSTTGAFIKSQDWLNYWWHLIGLFDCDRTAFSLDS